MAKGEYERFAAEVGRIERIAADRELTHEEVQQLNDLATQLRRSASGGKRYRVLYRRVRDVQLRILDPKEASEKARRAGQRGVRAVLPPGTVGSPGLSLAKREVLSGLPASRRGH